jgi:hypothetical protein
MPSTNLFKDKNISLPDRINDFNDININESFPHINYNMKVLRTFDTEYAHKIREEFPYVHVSYQLSRLGGRGYFSNMCYKIKATNKSGEEISLIDGGESDWTEKLLSDTSERFFGSGFGSEILLNNFKK